MLLGFSNICEWLEEGADAELYRLKEVYDQMCELNGGAPTNSIKSLKQKLKDHYGDNLYFAEIAGRSNVGCFKDMADRILNDLKKKSATTTNDIIAAEAKLIKSDIRQMPSNMNEYPSIDSLHCIEYAKFWVPQSLQSCLTI